jgi:N-acetylglucosamine repressor
MPRQPIGNRTLIRAINRSLVLNTIKSGGPISRTQVARRTGLSPATVSGITAELMADGLIFEKAPGDSRGGRRPILLALNPRGGYVVGVKLTETQAVGALTDLEATVVAKQTLPLSGRTPEAVIATLAGAVDGLLREGHVRRKQLLGVGIGVAGIVHAEAGILRQSPFLGWRDLPLRDMLRDRLHVPVYIDNDVNTLTLAERWFGAGQGVDHFLVVTVGRGVGMGIVLNGQFYRGTAGGAGEFGHTVVDPEGPLCDCGKRGCLEALVGDPGLLRMASEAFDRGEMAERPASPEALLASAQAGEEGARAVLSRAGEILGCCLANLINVFDPQLIIISGEGVRAGEWLFGPMRQSIDRHVMPGLAGDTEIRIDRWDDDAWARGAASLVLRELFESPVHGQPVEAMP